MSDLNDGYISELSVRLSNAETEIERLHGVQKTLQAIADETVASNGRLRAERQNVLQDLRDALAEVERLEAALAHEHDELRVKNEHLRAERDGLLTGSRKLQAEIEQLRARVSELVAVLDRHHGTPCEQIRHEQEIERLKAALEAMTKIAQSHERTIMQLTKPSARAALGGK